MATIYQQNGQSVYDLNGKTYDAKTGQVLANTGVQPMPGSYAAIQQQASQPSIAFGAVNTGPVPVSTLTSTATPYTPPPAPPMPQVQPIVTGAIAGATTPPPVITPTPTPTPTDTMSFSERLKAMLGSDVNTFLSKPTSLAEQRTALRGEYDIAGKEKAVNDLSAQLASITAKYQTAPLILEQQAEGRGITTDVLNRQQAQAQRNYAIEALPVTAALNAAQGRLDSANRNITDLLGVIKEDQDSTYQYQKDVLARAIDIASEDQKQALEARSAQLDAQKVRQTQLNSIKNKYIDAAIKAGDYATAGSMANVTDESQLVSLASQIRNTNPDLQFVSGTDNQAAGYFNKTTGVFTPLRTGGGGSIGTGTGSNEVQLYAGLSSPTATAVRAKVTAFKGEPQVQNFATIQDGYNFAKSIDIKTKNPADDQALIYSLAKALDPGSVVREGEYATAQKYAQSWIKSYGKGVEQALAGTGFLSEEARNNIKKTIEQKYISTKKTYDNLYSQYSSGINSLTGRKDGDKFLTDYAIQATTNSGVQSSSSNLPADIQTKVSSSVTFSPDGTTAYIPRSVWSTLGTYMDAVLREAEADGIKLLVQ